MTLRYLRNPVRQLGWQAPSLRQALAAALCALACLLPLAVPAQVLTWRTDKAVVPRHVVLLMSFQSQAVTMASPWVAAADALNAQGIALAIASPADDQPPVASRSTSEIGADIRAKLQDIRKTYPGLPIHLAGFGIGASALVDAAAGMREIDRLVIASGDFRRNRPSDWVGYKHPVMLLHAPSAQCDTSPYLEADWVAQKNQFALVQMGYAQTDPRPGCGRGSHHVFASLVTQFAATVVQWLDGATAPTQVGNTSTQVAWREQLLHYNVPATLGTNRLEMTLMLPNGTGPFPVAVFNHGDIDIGSTYIRHQSRFVHRIVAREFLQLGWAVAFPTRRGVGLSEGNYPFKNFHANDGDATFKARVHAQDILPALEYLKTHPDLDASRRLVMGQSAGGYATMHIASMNLPGVVGAINFSGGRTDKVGSGDAGFLNKTMVNGFAEFGMTTKLPMLWVFAENDSRYTANTIRASHQAFTEAGGKALLSLSPPIQGDGHFIYNRPELWRKAMRDYLVEINGTPREP